MTHSESRKLNASRVLGVFFSFGILYLEARKDLLAVEMSGMHL